VDDPDSNAVPDVSSPTIGRRLVAPLSDGLQRCGERLQLGRLGVLIVMGAIGAVAFAGLVLSSVSEDVVTGDGIAVRDVSNLQLFTDHRSGLLVSAARALTDLGSVGVLVLVALAAAVVLWFRGVRIIVAAAPLAALLVAGACAGVVKVLVARQRPPVGLRLVSESGASFPSGHSTDSTALLVTLGLVVAVVLLQRPLARVAVVAGAGVLAGLIGWSRLELGVHWPTDVLAGWSLGFAVAVAVSTLTLVLDHQASAGTTPTEADRRRVTVRVHRFLTTDRSSLRAVSA
jgi:hypothetical protein